MMQWLMGANNLSELDYENKLLAEKWNSYSHYTNLEKIKQKMINVKYFFNSQSIYENHFTESEYNYLVEKKI